MTEPESFYSKRDYPSSTMKHSMWSAIERSVFPGRQPGFFGLERRSFVFGMAAAIVLVFAAVGVYTTARNAIELTRPQTIRFDQAYQSAIREFEQVALTESQSSKTTAQAGLASARRDQLRSFDVAIVELKEGTNSKDLSPLKHELLRQLYAQKLKLLQEMIERGEIEL